MSQTIYRKYRPQKWSDLTGQNHIKVTLQNEIETGKLAHAFLFTGPRGIGKTTTARLLAKSLNCVERKETESEPCNKCDSCIELTGGQDLDILEIDAASHTGVDHVREQIITNARFTPAKRKYKVFIIDEVHMLSISAFNALLKILEEPPEHAIFILATTEIHKVPATIISRCQRFDFKKITSQDLKKRLSMIAKEEGIKISNKVLSDITHFSEGCLRDAESLLGQILSLGDTEITDEEASLVIPSSNYNSVIELIDGLVYKNVEASISLINKLVDDGVDLIQFSDDLIEFLRRMILTKISGGLKDYSMDLDEKMEKTVVDLATKFEIPDLINLINIVTAKKFEIKTAVITQLPLEIAVIEYCQSGPAKSEDKKEPTSPNDNQDPPGVDTNQPEKSSSNESSGSPPLQSNIENTKGDNPGGVNNTTLNSPNLQEIEKKADPDMTVSIKLEDIKEKWHQFLVKLQDVNASLVFILKIAEPLELKGNILKLGFKYEFHQKRVCQAKICESIEKILKEFFGEQLVLATCLFDKEYKSDFIDNQTKQDEVELVDEISHKEDGQQEELINNLVETFGGKVVE